MSFSTELIGQMNASLISNEKKGAREKDDSSDEEYLPQISIRCAVV